MIIHFQAITKTTINPTINPTTPVPALNPTPAPPLTQTQNIYLNNIYYGAQGGLIGYGLFILATNTNMVGYMMYWLAIIQVVQMIVCFRYKFVQFTS